MSNIKNPVAYGQMNAHPYTSARILRDLPVNERLAECTMCYEPRLRLVQLGVIGHQIALCGPCLRICLRGLQSW